MNSISLFAWADTENFQTGVATFDSAILQIVGEEGEGGLHELFYVFF